MHCRIVMTRINPGIPGHDNDISGRRGQILEGHIVDCSPRENQTIGFDDYRCSVPISPTETSLAGQEQAKRRQGQGVPARLGFGRRLWFGLSELKVDAWLVMVGLGEWMECIEILTMSVTMLVTVVIVVLLQVDRHHIAEWSHEILHGGAIEGRLLAPTFPPDSGLFGLCLSCLWVLNNLVVR
jgi:hypothetical protein